MNVSTLVRAVAFAGLAGTLAACGDTAPTAPATLAAATTPSLQQFEASGTININTAVSQYYWVGKNWVYVPAGAICAAGSGYGAELWDAPCSPATGTVAVQATVTEVGGYPQVEFYPDMRFKPTSSGNWRDWVIVGLKVNGSLNSALRYNILYRPTGTNVFIDEALTDPSLRAFRTSGNVIARRLKHFSGYNVSLGIYEEQSDPTGGAQ